MLDKLIQLSLQNKSLALLAAALVFAAGLFSAKWIAIDAVPDITNVQVVVNTATGALDPEQVEKTVTAPLEAELTGLPGTENVRSISKYGLSQVTVIFKDGTDIYWARQQVGEKIQAARGALPGGLSPELGPISTGLGEVFMYILQAKNGSELSKKPEKERLLYLRTVQDFVVRPRLKSLIPGVADIDTVGGYKKEIHIDLKLDKLTQHGLSMNAVHRSLETVGESFGGGYLEQNGEQMTIRTTGRIASLENLKAIPVRLSVSGRPIRLSDIAEVREGSLKRLGAATYRGEETVYGNVLMLLGANSREVAKAAEESLAGLDLPEDVEIRKVYSRSGLVDATIRTVARNLAEGAALVIMVLFLLMGNIRAAFLISLAIPFSMLFAAIGMKTFHISADLISLGAVDFGLLVDASIIVVERFIFDLEKRGAEGPLTSSEKAGLLSASLAETAKPVAFGLAIIMMVYLPILSLQGIEGKMFRPMAETLLMALGASLLAALFLMPALAFFWIRVPKKTHREPAALRFLKKSYEPVLHFGLQKKAWILSAAGLWLVLSAAVFFRLGSDFIPALDEGDLVINLTRESRISLTESISLQKKSDRLILNFPEVETVYSRTGQNESATDPMGVHLSDVFVILKKDRSEWPLIGGKRRTKTELFEAIARDLESNVSGQEISQSQPIEMRFNEILEGSRADVSLRFYGRDLDALVDLLEKGEALVKPMAGAASVEMDALTALRKSPVLSFDLNYDEIARYGVSVQEVNETLETALAGKEVGSLYEYDRRFPIILRMADEDRSSPEVIAQLPVSLGDGGSVSLDKLTRRVLRDEVTTIAREKSRRYSSLAINLDGERDVAGFVREAKKKIGAELPLPAGIHIEWGGQSNNLEKARGRLFFVIPLTLLAIFLLLWQSLGSFRLSLLVYTGIPFALTGGILSLWITGISLSISAAIGFITLMGISILNGLVLVAHYEKLRKAGVVLNEILSVGTMEKFRPIAITALVAMLGFIPMAVNSGTGSEVQKPLAVVVIGGILTSSFLTLVVFPILYAWFKGKREDA